MVAELGDALRKVPEVTDFQSYVGISSPFNFNGLVRHYYLRKGANVAEIQVNLVRKDERQDQSHDIAKRIRPLAQGDRRPLRRAGSRWRRSRPGRRSSRRWSPRCTGRTRQAGSPSPRKVKEIFTVDARGGRRRLVPGGRPAELPLRGGPREGGAFRGGRGRGGARRCRSRSAGATPGSCTWPREKEPVYINLRLPVGSRNDLVLALLHLSAGRQGERAALRTGPGGPGGGGEVALPQEPEERGLRDRRRGRSRSRRRSTPS